MGQYIEGLAQQGFNGELIQPPFAPKVLSSYIVLNAFSGGLGLCLQNGSTPSQALPTIIPRHVLVLGFDLTEQPIPNGGDLQRALECQSGLQRPCHSVSTVVRP